MNTIEKIIKNISDKDLKTGILEIQDWHNSTILKDGIVRDIAKKIKKELNNSYDLRIAEDHILMEGALRFCRFII